MSARVLVAGVGNIFLGDDAFGSEVARHLAARPLPGGAEVRDYGIGGVHLAYDLLDGYDGLVLIDAAPRGDQPGTIYVIEITQNDLAGRSVDPHAMDPGAVLGTLAALDGELPRTVLVGCEPADTGEQLGLSPPVSAAVTAAADTVLEVLTEQFGLGTSPAPSSHTNTKEG